MRLDVLHRRKPASPASLLLRDAWKYGVGVGVAALLLTAGGAERVQPHPQVLASAVLPTNVPCGPIATDALDPHTATWTATSSPYGTGSPYNLPVSATNNPDPNIPSCDAIVVPHDVTLKIDASQGAVQIFSHGAAIKVDGGHLLVLGTSETNSALFDAEPDVASWDGIVVTAPDSTHRGNASLAFASIQHALSSITITSGATSTPDPTNPSSSLPFGLALVNSGIGPSYFDGIDATNTPVLVQGRADTVKHRADGKFGTVNNIGSQGIKLNFDASAPAVPEALHVDSVAFGSSVPFAETSCLPLQDPCSRGSIGNDAILANFTSANPPPVSISQSRFYRAGSFGIELNGPNRPVIKDNNFDCNGTGSSKPTETCVGTGLKYSAIYLNNATADLENSITNNVGHEDGLDAIGFNGTIAYASSLVPQRLTWKNATNDAATDHALGYLLNGALNLTSGTLMVPGGSVVKSKGAINLTAAALDASDTSDSRTKVFTSLRDNANIPGNTNIVSCPSVFVQSCPSPLPAGEWGGINLVGSRSDATIRSATRGTISNAAILYATTGVNILNGASLAITGSAIGPTFADGVLAEGTPIAVTGTTFGCPAGVCSGPSNGNHGILADFRTVGALSGGLKVGGPNAADKNTFQGSVNEAIRGVGLLGQTVDVENNEIQNAGAIGSAGSAGIYLQGADNLTLKRNHVVGSGTGNLRYPAIWLDGVSNADFGGPISDNTGSGNGLNAIAFHGDTKTLAWQTAVAGGQLGFIVDANLLVAGDLTLANGDYAPVQGGTITVQNGTLTSTGAILTSLKEQTLSQPSCGSVFVPRISGVCPPQSAGDWGGLVLDPGKANRLTDSQIRYAVTGVSIGTPTGTRLTENLTLTGTSISRTASDGLSTRSPVSISGGAFTNNGGRGIKIDLTGVIPSAVQPLTITGHTAVSGSGQDGILAVGLGGHTVQLQDATVDHAGAFGINLKDANHLTLVNNIVTNSAATFPAIYLNGFSGLFANISGNKGAGNGIDAIAFHGTVTDDLTWQTARQTGDPTKLLGYVLDNTLNMQSASTLTVNAGDIVKVGNGGLLNLQGVNLKADDTENSSQKVFTSLTDDSVGVAACHSAVVTGCTGAPQAGDWGGISLTGSGANGALVNAAVRYGSTAIQITSQASSTSGSSSFGLVVFRSSIGPSSGDGISAVKTSISVTNSTVSGGTHGISFDYGGAMPNTAVRLSGNRFMSTSAEAILGQALSGRPVWITDNHIGGAGAFGIRLLNADEVVLRNNNVAGSGGGPGAGSGRYPAIYLNAVSADFVQDVRGNVGSGNGLDALEFDGKVTSDLTWITPSNTASTHPLGYLLDGSLALQGGNLAVGPGDVVKSLGGPITINGGTLTAIGSATPGGSPTSHSAIFTSLKDNPSAPVLPTDASDAAAVSCPSVLVGFCSPAPGDWGGLVITNNAAGLKGSGTISYGLINYANSGVALDSGPISASPETSNFRLTVANTTIANASKDGITSLDTPLSVDSSTVQSVGANGIIASFFSPANCASTPAPCVRLNITNVHVTGTGKDGIIANGLGEHPITVSGNTVTGAGAYGIRLVGPDQITLANNTVNTSGIASNAYPAIYLSNVTGDFNAAITGNLGAGNGLNALVFHGTANNGLTWVTPGNAGTTLGFMLDGPLTVNGKLTATGLYDSVTNALLKPGVVKVLTGAIKVNGALSSTDTIFTSMKENSAPLACPTVFISACPTVVAPSDYWGGVNIDADPSTFTGGALRDATSGLTINGAELDITGAVLSHVSDYSVHTVGTGNAVITCASIHDNAGGVRSNGAATTTIDNSDLLGNTSSTTKDVEATVATTAKNNWWGVDPPDPSQYTTTYVTVAPSLPQQPPTLTHGSGKIEFFSDNTNASTGYFGKGTLTVRLTFDRKMNTDQALNVSFVNAGDGNVHQVSGSWDTAGKFVWTGSVQLDATGLSGASGTNTLTVSGGQSCVPDGTNLMSSETGTFTLDFGTASVAGTGGAQNIGAQSATLTDSVNPNGWSQGVQPPDLTKTDSHAFFQYKLDGGSYDASIIAGIQAGTINPASQLGYQSVGRGTVAQAVSTSVSGLTASTTYDYRVVAIDLNGITVGTDQSLTTTAVVDHFVLGGASTTASGDPYSISVTAKDLGGNTVADYSGTVHFTSGDGQAVLPADYAFVGADNGVHSFSNAVTLKTAGSQTLIATDTVGSGITGQLTVTVTPKVPGAPTGVSAQPGSSQAVVTWTAPADNGGTAITKYTVTASPGGASAITPDGTTLTATVIGLTPGTAYTFQVVATNVVGDGPASAASNSVTPYTTPGAPTGATAAPGSSQATVTWTAPASDGGSAITAYTVTSSPDSKTATTLNGNTISATVTGLTPGTAYAFTVVATNAAGHGSASGASNSVTPYTVPGAPTGVSGQPGNGEAVVTWTAPASDGGSPLTKYTVTAAPGGASAMTSDGSTLTATVTGLTNGTAYTFTVVATNAAGDSVPSSASTAITVGAPAAPGSVSAVAGSAGEATVSWSLPSDNGSAIDHFTVTPFDGTTAGTPVQVPGPSATSVLVAGLASGTTYTFQVTATNVAGTSPTGISSGVTIN